MKSFIDLGISEGLNKVLKENRIYEPTPIQEISIPRILEGGDIVGQAQTGTGKTLAFMLPIFEMIDEDKLDTQVLIITPTRELALQLTEEAKKLSKYKPLEILAVYGGQDVNQQLNKLTRGVQLIIATPGRLLDHINRGSVNLSKIKHLVIDEADEIINMGFFDDVEKIIEKTPPYRQTLLYSATMPNRVKSISRKLMKSPIRLEASEKDITVDQIEEVEIRTTHRQKEEDLINYLEEHRPFMAIIFCRTKARVKKLTTSLAQKGYNVDEIHGDLSQAKRERAMKKFRDLETQYLVATDLAARGLDIDGVTHVFNYDEPEKKDSYTHRIGRTGRAGGEGVAVTFIVDEPGSDSRRGPKGASRRPARNKKNTRNNRGKSKQRNRRR